MVPLTAPPLTSDGANAEPPRSKAPQARRAQGAWGVQTLRASERRAGSSDVIAITPDPHNRARSPGTLVGRAPCEEVPSAVRVGPLEEVLPQGGGLREAPGVRSAPDRPIPTRETGAGGGHERQDATGLARGPSRVSPLRLQRCRRERG